jgi:hypothetical protein
MRQQKRDDDVRQTLVEIQTKPGMKIPVRDRLATVAGD